jgi:addiction module HigA family antidote
MTPQLRSMSKLPITTEWRTRNEPEENRPHPGDTIREDFLKPLGMSVNKLALELRVPATRMMEIIHGRRGITADTALRLGRYFNTTPKFWLNLQASYDLAIVAEARSEEIERTVHPREAA